MDARAVWRLRKYFENVKHRLCRVGRYQLGSLSSRAPTTLPIRRLREQDSVLNALHVLRDSDYSFFCWHAQLPVLSVIER